MANVLKWSYGLAFFKYKIKNTNTKEKIFASLLVVLNLSSFQIKWEGQSFLGAREQD